MEGRREKTGGRDKTKEGESLFPGTPSFYSTMLRLSTGSTELTLMSGQAELIRSGNAGVKS